MSFSNYVEAALLNSLFGKTSDLGTLASAPTMYIALCDAAPTDSSTGSTISESDYGSYGRLSTSAGDWNAATGTSPTYVANSIVISFPQASSSGSSPVTHFALVDASTNGNMIAWGALSSGKAISNGSTPEFGVGALQITLD